MLSKTNVAGVILLTGALFLAGGCGYKNDPVPPDAIVPKAINDLRYSVSEKGVTLNWTFPHETIKGTDLPDIDTFDVYRAVVPVSDFCPTCPIPFREPIEVPGGVVDPESSRQGTYETALLRSGHKYFFKVSARTSWWAAGPDSNIVSFVWHTPAMGAEGVMTKAADSSAVVSWNAVTKLMDGQVISYPIVYQVQRSKDKVNFAAIGEVTSNTRFTDNALKNGVTYYYRIQSIIMVGKDAVSGGLSDVVNVTAIDQTPPSAPTGITAVKTSGGIKVFWEKSRDTDVKGYRVYRREANEKTGKLIGDISGVYSIFEDVNVSPKGSYFYSVTAYDQAENPNESNRSREAGIRR